MHILTKILVVFAAVLCLALAALTSAYAMNRDAILSSYNDAVAMRDKANSLYETQSSQFAEERSALNSQVAQLNNQIQQLQNVNREADAKIAELRLEARSSADRADSLGRQITGLGETAKNQTVLLESLQNEIRSARQEMLRAKEQQIATLDRVNDLENENEVLRQANRALQEQIAEIQETETTGGAIAGNTGGSSEPFTLATGADGSPIVGSIRDVRTNNGQQYAEVNLGERDRIRENAKLRILRNGNFLANLIIVRTDLQSSVGRVDTVGQPDVQVRPGDTVLSSLGQ